MKTTIFVIACAMLLITSCNKTENQNNATDFRDAIVGTYVGKIIVDRTPLNGDTTGLPPSFYHAVDSPITIIMSKATNYQLLYTLNDAGDDTTNTFMDSPTKFDNDYAFQIIGGQLLRSDAPESTITGGKCNLVNGALFDCNYNSTTKQLNICEQFDLGMAHVTTHQIFVKQ